MTATILVVDDSPESVRLLLDLLRPQGFRLIAALDGTDCLRKATAGGVDAILLDVRMPDPDGIAVCRLLKNDPRTCDIPVILLTALDAPEDKLKGFQAGASDYVTKPFLGDEVVARLNVHLNIRRRLRDLQAREQRPTVVDPAADADGAASQGERMVLKAKAILLEDMANPPALPELARRLGTNERRLTEEFRRHTGLPVFAFLREERHRRACELLLATTTGIGLIAEQVGYQSAAAFTNAFRDRFALSPRQYRRAAGIILPTDAETGNVEE